VAFPYDFPEIPPSLPEYSTSGPGSPAHTHTHTHTVRMGVK